MHYTLNGKIASAHPYQLDKTLTVEGAGAEAKATGERIEEIKTLAESHVNNKLNPHGVTKAQLGLGNVDDTPDLEKPISVLQAVAIAEAKKAGTDAQAEAIEAMNAATDAQNTADGKASKVSTNVTLLKTGWTSNQQTVTCNGVTANDTDVIVSPIPTHYEPYAEYKILCTKQNSNALTFTCAETPEVDISVNVLILS